MRMQQLRNIRAVRKLANALSILFSFNVVSAASAIRDASSSAQKLKTITAVKTKAYTAKRESLTLKKDEKDGSSVKPRDRNRESLMYEDDDLNTSIPKLEKKIEKDKERIRLQQEDATNSRKKPAVNPSSSSNRSRTEKKMEASAQKFKTFLDSGLESTPKRDDKKTNGDLNNSLPRTEASKASTPTKIDVKTKTPVQSSKRPCSAHSSMQENSAKKRRSSISTTKQINYKPFGKLLEGVVIAISGIQVIDSIYSRLGLHCFNLCCEFRAESRTG